jgi:hypothetical protein
MYIRYLLHSLIDPISAVFVFLIKKVLYLLI